MNLIKKGGSMKKVFLGLMFLLMFVSPALASQHDYVIANQPGAAFRSDLNSAFQAIVTNNAGATEPATLYPNMWWYDVSTGLMKHRTNANDAWITLGLDAADTDGTLAANSDSKVATQKATKTYADNSFAKAYPVGSIYMSTVSTNPGTLFGFGTWVAIGAGRVLVGKDTSGTFSTAGATGGAETKTISEANLPPHLHSAGTLAGGAHTHSIPYTNGGAGGSERITSSVSSNWVNTTTGSGGGGAVTGSTGVIGSGTAMDVMNPYLVVYMWTRTS